MISTGQHYHCDECQTNLTDIVKIACATCPEFDLCVTCFSKGVEIANHKFDHPYSVVSKNNFPIFDIEWTADEELLLIDGLLQFGMGNWEEVANFVGSKDKGECESHYYKTYVESEDWPLPNLNLDLGTQVVRIKKNQSDTKQDSRPQKPISSLPSNHEVSGYMPGRKEFEEEYDNDAEQVIKDMNFNEDDIPEERELKLTILQIYNSKLDKRAERKNFLINRGLLDYSKNTAIEKRRSQKNHESVLASRISQLKEWRKNGISTVADGMIYELEKVSRQNRSRTTSSKDCIQNLEKIQKLAFSFSQRRVSSEVLAQNKPVLKKSKANSISFLDGAQLLSTKELELCKRLSVSPSSYIIVKDVMLSEYIKHGKLEREKTYQLFENVDPIKIDNIYDFFSNA
ncbi:hypothetical protein BB560_006798, partial [Smittium megazygosporum]